MSHKALLVCDLDNTLYDWVSYFVPAFYAMVDTAVEVTGCDREKLLDDFRVVHQLHGDSEQPFALLETQSIRDRFRGVSVSDMANRLDPAFHAFNSVRKKNLKLHPYVHETLQTLSGAGVKLIAHTESKLYGVVDRLARLELFGYFEKIYCRERSPLPHPNPRLGDSWLEKFPMHKVVELSHHQSKPNPEVLAEICSNEGILPENAAYVGDSVARDVLMAKRANVFAIWAAYGATHDSGVYDALVRISHWTANEVAREKQLREEARHVEPDFIARHSFDEILAVFGLQLGYPVSSIH